MRSVLLLSFCLVCILTSSAEAITWPTSHPPDAIHAHLRKGYGSAADEYNAYFWWADGFLWQEVDPVTESAFICGGDLKQNGKIKYYFLRTAIGGRVDENYFCGELAERRIFYIDASLDGGPVSYLGTTIMHDGFSDAYDASIYIPNSSAPPYETSKLTITAIGSGKITGNIYSCDSNKQCIFSVKKGESVGINGIPDDGYLIGEWSGACSGNNQYCFFTMSGDKEAKISFKPVPKSVDPWIAPEDLTPYESSGIQKELYLSKVGLGIVRSQMDWIYCGTRCSASFNKNQRITLTATPAPGWIFKKWKGACSNAKPVCNVKLNQKKKVKAVFIENPLNNLPGCGDVCSCARDLSPILGPGIIPIGCK